MPQVELVSLDRGRARVAMRMRGLLKVEIARLAGVGPATTCRAMRGDGVSVTTARAIAHVLRVPYADLLAVEPAGADSPAV